MCTYITMGQPVACTNVLQVLYTLSQANQSLFIVNQYTNMRTYLSEAVWSLPLFLLVAEVPLLLWVCVLVGGSLYGSGLGGDVCPGCVQVSQGHQVNQHPHTIGIKKDLDVLFVMEQLINEHQQTVTLRSILTLKTINC